MCNCRAQYLLWGTFLILGLLSMFGCGAKGDLYLPEQAKPTPSAQVERPGQPEQPESPQTAEPNQER